MQYNHYPAHSDLLKPNVIKGPDEVFDIKNIVSDTTGFNLGLVPDGGYAGSNVIFTVNFTTAAPKDMYLIFEFPNRATIPNKFLINHTTVLNTDFMPVDYTSYNIPKIDTLCHFFDTYLGGGLYYGDNVGTIFGTGLPNPATNHDPLQNDMSTLVYFTHQG